MEATADRCSYEKAPTLSAYNRERRVAASSWLQLAECAACLSNRISPFATIRSVAYYNCNDCGFVFANPRPSSDYLSEFYNSPFYNNYRSCERERIAKDPYFSISTEAIPMLASWIKDDPKASVLDFGCGPASFLAYLRDKYDFVNLSGIDLNKQSAAVAQMAYGMTIATDLSGLKDNSFDIAVLIEVIEHVSNVDEIMRLVDRLVRPGGRLLVTTDAVNNPVSRYFPSWAPHFTGPSHISLFTELALSRLLQRFGYEIERKESARCNQLFGDFVLSPAYELDFASPTSMEELDDRLYVPNRVGRRLRLRPSRKPPQLFRAVQKLDGIAGRAIGRLFPAQFSSHQFVLARRT
jgi:2-polyprenyl-3-methyl-5-hydroxy-6-metoxy-1,4-benzoquinol methylase